MDPSALRRAGIDYEAGVARFLGDKELYEEVLGAFLSETSLEEARTAFEGGDETRLLAVAHEVKGSSGNADMAILYEASCSLVALLRDESSGDGDLRAAFTRFEAAYLLAREGVREALVEL